MPWSGTTVRRYSTPSGRVDHHGQIDVGNGDAGRVAQQRRHMHRLAGAVDAALGEHEGIEPLRHVAPGDAAVGQIEGRLCEIEEGIVAAVARGDQQSRRKPAFAARQAGLEGHSAIGVGLLDREHIVVARQQPDLDLFQRSRWTRAN